MIVSDGGDLVDVRYEDRQTQEAWNNWVRFTKAVVYVTIGTAAILLLLLILAL